MMGETATRDIKHDAGQPRRRLTRSKADRALGGVCGGLGSYFGVDPVVFRIALVVLALSGWGGGVLVYVIAWLVMPEGEGVELARGFDARSGAMFIGFTLVALGAVTLIERLVPSFDEFFWPLALMAVGIAFVIGGVRRDSRA